VETVAAAAPEPEPEPAGSIADVRRILARSKPQRFPMYIRNVKQLLRQTEPGFDERRFGFSNIVDVLRALQRDQMVRLERDRQGALRVFQGPAWAQPAERQDLAAADMSVQPAEAAADATVEVPEDPGVFLEAPVESPVHEITPGEPEQPKPERKRRRTRKTTASQDGTQVEKIRKPRAAKGKKTTQPKRRTRKTQQPEVTEQ
jgi:hypothetical protein